MGLVRDLNPGPLTPKARIIPLDQQLLACLTRLCLVQKYTTVLLNYSTDSISPHYQLVLDGWGLESTVYLTRLTTNRKVNCSHYKIKTASLHSEYYIYICRN